MKTEGGIFLSKNEQIKFSIIDDFIKGKISRMNASDLLKLSTRQISRIAKKISIEGIMGILHGNRNRTPTNKSQTSFKKQVLELVEKNYFDFNVTHCKEILLQNHEIKIGYMTLLRWLREKNLVKRRHKRRAKIRKYRERMPCEGMMLQFDGSHHKWNGQHEWCLIGAIDDATSEIPYCEFFNTEDTLNCMSVLQKIIEKKGIPYSIYVDRAGWFGGTKRQDFSQFKRACEELNIRVLFASSPQAKGRIERAWNTLQDRLIPEMRIRNIHRIPAANNFLQKQFIPNYWNKELKVIPRDLEIKYRPISIGMNLNEIFCFKETRVVASNETISYESKIYVVDSPTGYPLRRQKIEIRTYQDLSWKAYYAGKAIELRALEPVRRYGT